MKRTPGVQSTERDEANASSSEKTSFHLLTQFDPETLLIAVVKIDDLDKEDNNASSPEY